jgi:methionine-rich copper-binding protein CopC
LTRHKTVVIGKFIKWKEYRVLIKFKMTKMTSMRQCIALFAVLALAILSVGSVSALVDFDEVEVSDIDGLVTDNVNVLAGQTVPVRVIFTAEEDAEDVRVKVWITGERDLSVSTDRFDIIEGNTYSRLLHIRVPFDIDPDEERSLKVLVESRSDDDEVEVDLVLQRESYIVEILAVSMDTKVTAGDNLFLDVVIKNRGRQFAEDTFVSVKIPALDVERKVYFGDLSPEDVAEPDKEDALERRLFLNIPSNAPAGIYVVEVDAFNDDSITTVKKKVAIANGASDDSLVISPITSRVFSTGETEEYSMTLVNSGDNVRVYELVFETGSSGLTFDSEQQVVVLPAGSSKTAKFLVSSEEQGLYSFAVNIHSGGELVERQEFSANIRNSDGRSGSGANATVLFTVILVIIFVVLLVVLIVLLTRKPSEKSEEFGESYY